MLRRRVLLLMLLLMVLPVERQLQQVQRRDPGNRDQEGQDDAANALLGPLGAPGARVQRLFLRWMQRLPLASRVPWNPKQS